MDPLNKLLYCLVLSNCNDLGKIESYAKYTTLEDQRTLAIGMAEKFYVRDNNSPEILLKYILNKEKYIKIMKKRFEKIEKHFNEVKNGR
jgi:hypothetical protein